MSESNNHAERTDAVVRIFEQEQVTAKIGEGGMSEVYRARDIKLDTP